MSSNTTIKAKNLDADLEQRAIDKLEVMWDRELSKGDDEFFEAVDRQRAVDNKENDQPVQTQRPRGGRKRM